MSRDRMGLRHYTYPTVYAVPVYTVPPQAVVVTPAPTVVQYPHGRYELRGDGVTTPYFWAKARPVGPGSNALSNKVSCS